MEQDLIDSLINIAKKPAWSDNPDFTIYDYSGGNYDDAYYGGYDDGEISLAREILTKLDILHTY